MRRTRERDRFIDEIDRRIIARLELDARVTNQALAQAVMLSPSACLQRVRRLEQNGIIKRYIADIDEAELDCLIFHAELLLTAAGRASRKTLEQAFAVRPEILYAAQVCGRADYILKIGGRAPNVWPSLLDEIDPEGRLIAQSSVQTHVRIAKRFGGLSRLSD